MSKGCFVRFTPNDKLNECSTDLPRPGSPVLEQYTAAEACCLVLVVRWSMGTTGHFERGCFTPPADEAYSEDEDVHQRRVHARAHAQHSGPGSRRDILVLLLDPHSE